MYFEWFMKTVIVDMDQFFLLRTSKSFSVLNFNTLFSRFIMPNVYRFIYIIISSSRMAIINIASRIWLSCSYIYLYMSKSFSLVGRFHVVCLDFCHSKKALRSFYLKKVILVPSQCQKKHYNCENLNVQIQKCRMSHDQETDMAYSWMKLFPKRVSFIFEWMISSKFKYTLHNNN